MGRRRTWIVLGAIVLVLIVAAGSLAGTYNGLVGRSEKINEQWAQIQSQLQRRYDLIPNLVETVKGYAAHEQGVFTAIAEARAKLAGAATPEQQVEAANQLEGALARLLVIVERYPELKANEQFNRLMDELAGTENRIQVARARYNTAVKDYNFTIRRFPTVVVARLLGFDQRAYFEAGPEAQGAPKVNFGQ
ncbi:MAG TPA: LemA family protein [Firmicutes bacterium]|nr:LemA family protein [Bacillota bacterium]